MNEIDGAIEFAFIYSIPFILTSPLLFIAIRGMLKAFSGSDGILNSSVEGWDLLAGILALMGINFYYGSKLLEVYYKVHGIVDAYTFWLTVIAVLGGAAKANPKIFEWLINKFVKRQVLK